MALRRFTDQKIGSRAGGGRFKDIQIILGETKMYRNRNGHIRGTTKVKQLGNKVREARSRWMDIYRGECIGHFPKKTFKKRSTCLEAL